MLANEVNPPAPAPLINLPKIKRLILELTEHIKQPTENEMLQNNNNALLPKISLSFPYRGWNVADETRYEVAIHDNFGKASNSLAILPLKVVTITESNEARNTPTYIDNNMIAFFLLEIPSSTSKEDDEEEG
jgi:hypothetical protein